MGFADELRKGTKTKAQIQEECKQKFDQHVDFTANNIIEYFKKHCLQEADLGKNHTSWKYRTGDGWVQTFKSNNDKYASIEFGNALCEVINSSLKEEGFISCSAELKKYKYGHYTIKDYLFKEHEYFLEINAKW